VPRIRKFVEDNLVFELMFILILGFIGMIIFLRKSYVSGAWHPAQPFS
jgi:preprotein translocase subunit Sss1